MLVLAFGSATSLRLQPVCLCGTPGTDYCCGHSATLVAPAEFRFKAQQFEPEAEAQNWRSHAELPAAARLACRHEWRGRRASLARGAHTLCHRRQRLPSEDAVNSSKEAPVLVGSQHPVVAVATREQYLKWQDAAHVSRRQPRLRQHRVQLQTRCRARQHNAVMREWRRARRRASGVPLPPCSFARATSPASVAG